LKKKEGGGIMRAFKLKDMIVSPMGLGETITVWISISSWKSYPFEGKLEGTHESFYFKVLDIQEPEVKLQIRRYKF